jgi:hypothetical protein
LLCDHEVVIDAFVGHTYQRRPKSSQSANVGDKDPNSR